MNYTTTVLHIVINIIIVCDPFTRVLALTAKLDALSWRDERRGVGEAAWLDFTWELPTTR